MKNHFGGIAGGVFVGICLPIVLGSLRVPALDLGWTETFAAGLGLIAVWFAAVAAHEAGHVVAGMAAAFRPYLLAIGPVAFERTAAGWQLRKNRAISWSGGLAVGLPRGAERLRQRVLLMIAGGPLASALTVVLGLTLYMLFRPADVDVAVEGWGALRLIWCLGLAIMSLFLLVITLAPATHQGFRSDGSRILELLMRGEPADVDVAVLTLCSASMAGQRPRDWDEALVARAQSAACDSANGVVGAYLAHWHALDRGDLTTARARLATALEHREAAPALTRAGVTLQAAKFYAAFEGETATARELLDEAAPITAPTEPQRLIAEAAIAAVGGAPDANDLIARALDGVGRAQDGCTAVDRELLERFRTHLSAATA